MTVPHCSAPGPKSIPTANSLGGEAQGNVCIAERMRVRLTSASNPAGRRSSRLSDPRAGGIEV